MQVCTQRLEQVKGQVKRSKGSDPESKEQRRAQDGLHTVTVTVTRNEWEPLRSPGGREARGRTPPFLIPQTAGGAGTGRQMFRGRLPTSVTVPFHRAHLRRQPCHWEGGRHRGHQVPGSLVHDAGCLQTLAGNSWLLGAWAQGVAKKPPVPGEAESGDDSPSLWKRGAQVPGGSMSKPPRVTPGLADPPALKGKDIARR